ncbi:MAG TPA: DinB family protein [Fimbriimonadaceae bacterium]|nr:DinB family protein [Fimbriimonadaceae bacterium]
MKTQDFLAQSIEKKHEQVFALARTVPAERLDWSPGGQSRSVLDQLQELGIIVRFYVAMLQDKAAPEPTPDMFEKYQADRKKLATIDECEASAKRHTDELTALIRSYSDEDLDLHIILPFMGGKDLSMADLAMMVYWNLSYHEGQIQFILNMLAEPTS